MARPWVDNAARVRDVRAAGRRGKRRQEDIDALHRAVLDSPVGRAFVADLLERAGLYESLGYVETGLAYLAGRQDFGKELRDRCIRADEEQFARLEREARARQRAEDRTTEALHTPRADRSGTESEESEHG